jgi:hypothetical protein
MNRDDEIADRIVGATARLVGRWIWWIGGILFLSKFGVFVLIWLFFLGWALLIWLSQFGEAMLIIAAIAFIVFTALLILANIWHTIKWWRSI